MASSKQEGKIRIRRACRGGSGMYSVEEVELTMRLMREQGEMAVDAWMRVLTAALDVLEEPL